MQEATPEEIEAVAAQEVEGVEVAPATGAAPQAEAVVEPEPEPEAEPEAAEEEEDK